MQSGVDFRRVEKSRILGYATQSVGVTRKTAQMTKRKAHLNYWKYKFLEVHEQTKGILSSIKTTM